MQIFRVSENHEISARYLDNRRLSKQVLELYQIIRVCLSALNIIDGNIRYLHHPIVKHVYNEGHPYILDCFAMLKVMDDEHTRRGVNVQKHLRKTSTFWLLLFPNISIYLIQQLYHHYMYMVQIRFMERMLI